MAIVDPKLFSQSVGLSNLPAPYATNIAPVDVSPFLQAQRTNVQRDQLEQREKQFNLSHALRKEQLEEKRRAVELDAMEKKMTFIDKLGNSYLAADAVEVQAVYDDVGLTAALQNPSSTAKETLTTFQKALDNQVVKNAYKRKATYDKLKDADREPMGINKGAYNRELNIWLQDPKQTPPSPTSFYDTGVYDFMQDNIGSNKDMSIADKETAIDTLLTSDPSVAMQMMHTFNLTPEQADQILTGEDTDINKGIKQMLYSRYAIFGDDSDSSTESGDAIFRGAYDSKGDSWISDKERKLVADIVGGKLKGTTEERQNPHIVAGKRLFDSLYPIPEWREETIGKASLNNIMFISPEGFTQPLKAVDMPTEKEFKDAKKEIFKLPGSDKMDYGVKATIGGETFYSPLGDAYELLEADDETSRRKEFESVLDKEGPTLTSERMGFNTINAYGRLADAYDQYSGGTLTPEIYDKLIKEWETQRQAPATISITGLPAITGEIQPKSLANVKLKEDNRGPQSLANAKLKEDSRSPAVKGIIEGISPAVPDGFETAIPEGTAIPAIPEGTANPENRGKRLKDSIVIPDTDFSSIDGTGTPEAVGVPAEGIAVEDEQVQLEMKDEYIWAPARAAITGIYDDVVDMLPETENTPEIEEKIVEPIKKVVDTAKIALNDYSGVAPPQVIQDTLWTPIKEVIENAKDTMDNTIVSEEKQRSEDPSFDQILGPNKVPKETFWNSIMDKVKSAEKSLWGDAKSAANITSDAVDTPVAETKPAANISENSTKVMNAIKGKDITAATIKSLPKNNIAKAKTEGFDIPSYEARPDGRKSAAWFTYNMFNIKGTKGEVATISKVDPEDIGDERAHIVYASMEEGWNAGMNDIRAKLTNGDYDKLTFNQMYSRYQTGDEKDNVDMTNLISAFNDWGIRDSVESKLDGKIEDANFVELGELVGEKAMAMAFLKAENGEFYKEAMKGGFSEMDKKDAIFAVEDKDLVELSSSIQVDGDNRLRKDAAKSIEAVVKDMQKSRAGYKLTLASAVRTPKRQFELNFDPSIGTVTKPFASIHNLGNAIDINRIELKGAEGKEFKKILNDNGWYTTYKPTGPTAGKEPNHFVYSPSKDKNK